MLPKEWNALTPEVKEKLALEHNITKNGHVEVVDNVVVSDGYLAEDLVKIPRPEEVDHLQGDVSRDSNPLDTRTANTVITERQDKPVEAEVIKEADAEVSKETTNVTVTPATNDKTKSEKTK